MVIQPRSSFSLGYVQPNGQSSQRLSEGFYSLSARSNVPFARLIGKSIDKTFTWGEIVEVPKGELCGVVNASFHGGDIFINGGCDYDNRPQRITVPVPYAISTTIFAGYFAPQFPGDVRMARRAYLCSDAEIEPTGLGTLLVPVVGQRFDGSHNTANELTFGSGYTDLYILSSSELLGMFPLGHNAVRGDDSRPHSLLTVASLYIPPDVVLPAATPTPNAYYVMEY